jgi:hypothetical protein
MLAKAGFPDTAAGRAAFHKQYPTPESFFQIYGDGGPIMYGAGGPFEEQTGEDPFAPSKSYLEGWQSSPMFKQIIQNQAEAMYPSKPKASADYYKRNTTPMYIPEGKSLMGVSAKNNNPNMYARYFPKDIIGIDKGLMDRDAALGNNLYTRAAVHDYNPPTAMDDEIINNTPAKRVKGEDNEYEYGNPLKASVHGLRQAGQASGIYDPFNEPFKKEYIDQYNEFYKTNPTKNPLNNLLKFYTPDQVEYFMNNISQNKGQSGDNMQMARHGGSVMYGSGGKLPQGILRSRLESHMSPGQAQSYINSYNVGGMINNFPDPPDDEIQRNPGTPTSAPYERFPKKDPGFGYRGPGSYWYYKEALKNTKIKTANPHKGVKDAPINMHTITGSCESGNCYEFADGGVVDALQLMGMPTPRMYGPGGFTGNPYSRFKRRGRNIGDDNITGYATGTSTNFRLPAGTTTYNGGSTFVDRYETGLDYTKDFYNDSNITLGGGLGLGRGTERTPSTFANKIYTPEQDKNFFTGSIHANADAHIPIGTASWGAQRQGHRNIGAGGVELAALNPSLEIGVDKYGKNVQPYYDASVGLGLLNNAFNFNAGYTNKTWNPQVNLPAGSTVKDEGAPTKGTPYIGMSGQMPLWIDNKGNTRLKVFGGYGLGRGQGQDAGFAGATYTFADGGHVTDYSPSSDFGTVQSMNNTYMHGYGNGGPVGMYKSGSFLDRLGNTWKNSMLLGADALTSAINTDIIGDRLYSGKTFFGDTPGTFTDASHYIGEGVNSILPTAANFVLPGSEAAIRGLQAVADPFIKDDQLRMQSKSGQNAALMGLGLDIAGAITSAGTSMAGAGKSAAEIAKTAPKTMKAVADASRAVQAAGVAADAYNTAKDSDANWKDWTRVGLNAVGAVGGDMASTGMERIANTQNPFGSMKGLQNLNKYSNIASTGTTLGNAAKAGKAGMSLYNTGENIDRYGLNSQTTMQGVNAIGQGLGAVSNFSENANFKDFSNTYNALGSAANLGMDLYNTIDSGSENTLDYASMLPQGLNTGMQINNMFSNQRPGQFTPSSLIQRSAMGGAVNAPNMMKYAQGGRTMLPPNVSTGRAIVNRYASGGSIGYNELDLTELSKQNNLMDNSRLLGYNLIGTDKFDAGSYVNKKPNSMKEEYEMFLKAKPVTKYYSPAMPPHPSDGSMDPRGTVTGTVDPQTGKPVEINVEGKEGRWLLPNGEHFITTKKDTASILAMYNNGDAEGVASKMANIKRAKEEKEAKATAMQQARENAAAQLEAMQMQAAKYGGMVNQYGYGGGVRMYALGGPPDEEGIPYAQSNPYTTVPQDQYIGVNPYAVPLSERPSILDMYMNQMQQEAANSTPNNYVQAPPVEVVQPEGLQPYNFNTILTNRPSSFASTVESDKEAFLQGYTGNTFSTPDPDEELDPNFVMPEQGPFSTERTYKSSEDDADTPLQGIVFTDAQGNEYVGDPYAPDYGMNRYVTSEEDKKKLKKYLKKQENKEKGKSNLQDNLITAGTLTPALTNLAALLFGKTPDYTVPQIPLLQWVNRSGESQKRALKQAYAASKYRLPIGSGNLAERTALAANYMDSVANLEEQIANANAMGYMDTQAKNSGITGQNIANFLTGENLKNQAKAARLNIGTTVGTQIGQVAEAAKMKKFYEKLYPTFSGGKYMINSKGDIVPIINTSTEKEEKKEKKDKKGKKD